jgi:protein CpxP
MFFRRHRNKLIAASIAAGLLGGGTALAANRHEHRMDMIGQHLAKVREQLKLNPEQDALWQQAETSTREQMRRMMEEGRGMRDKARAELDKPGADLRSVFAQGDQLRQQAEEARRQSRDKWLAVYDSLNPDQKEQVRVFMKARLDRIGGFGHGHHHRRG